MNQLKDNNNYKSIQVITLTQGETIILGRGHDTDVRISDISVSRNHASLILNQENKVLIKDLNSKFGTLALIQSNKLEILKGESYNLQIGRTICEFKLYNNQQYKLLKNEFQKNSSTISLKHNDKLEQDLYSKLLATKEQLQSKKYILIFKLFRGRK